MAQQLSPEVVEALIARERIAMAGRLLPGVVHNLSGAVQLVRLPLDLMELKLHRGDADDLSAKLVSAQEGMNRLNHELELLGGRIGQDNDLEPKVFDLCQLARDQLAFWPADMFFKHEVQLEKKLECGSFPVKAAYSDVALAFNALIQNALESLQAGGLREMSVASKSGDGRLELVVRDEAGGVPPEEASAVFEPFYSNRQGHQGLGLFLAKMALAPWQGGMEYRPGPDGGFVISLPMAG